MPSYEACGQEADLTDAEIALIVRTAAVHGMTSAFNAIDTHADCRLEESHEGDCASYQATLTGKTGAAWLRWGNGRRIDWLADCGGEGDCILYRGHPGQCDQDPQIARSHAHDR